MNIKLNLLGKDRSSDISVRQNIPNKTKKNEANCLTNVFITSTAFRYAETSRLSHVTERKIIRRGTGIC
ncbi:hypothetical protein RCL_jg12835.t1 [Rhizophagus clarus]|uniref:Uncharacterized protein n=1 Tax=Rhizophagus clarus TaxID=94130 RepID=A0A8H3KXD0_9GLOM|nr:hypothetical protein RCL_jg12835.t1 [Rhizophagus clarus]